MLRRVVRKLLSTAGGYVVEEAPDGGSALALLLGGFHGVIVLDVRLPDIEGPELFKRIRDVSPNSPVIFLTGYGSTDLALDTIQDGAFEFIEKDDLLNRLLPTVEHAAASILEPSVPGGPPKDEEGSFGGIVTQSQAMAAVFRSLRSAIDSNVSVLVHGESGTGKELVARAIHNYSTRRNDPFMAINCAGIPENLLEAELFGYERGAFTGAVSRKIGKFEAARGGTLFLDEIGELHPMLQAKLLRVLQEGELQRLGGNQTIQTDVRIVSATNRDLEQEIAEGGFRADLYYRLAVYVVYIPPLRERPGDVPLLLDFFVRRFAEREERPVRAVDPRVGELLELYDFPGNVRELENIVSYAVVSARGPTITIANLPPAFLRAVSTRKRALQAEAQAPTPVARPAAVGTESGEFPTLEQVERRHIERALKTASGNKTAAANLLGISRMTLYRKLSEYQAQEGQS